MSKLLWRISVEAPTYTADDLSGKGAEITGGRWNAKGTPVVYSSTNISLAALETMVHFGSTSLPLNRYLVQIEVPESIWDQAVFFNKALAPGWDALPPGKTCIQWGESWLNSITTALAFVPSVITPEENNCLINPCHPDARLIKARTIRKWVYDSRN